MAGRGNIKLTDPGIERMGKAPEGQRVERFDRLVPGLAIRVTDTGRKSWSVTYRFDGRTQRVTIGSWPATKVSGAREKARKIKEQAANGVDPKVALAAEKAETAAAMRTFGELAEAYVARETPKLRRGKEVESYVRRYLLPEWQNRPLTSLRRRDAVRLLDREVDAGREPTALKLHEIIVRIFNWAAARDEIEASPFTSLKPPASKEPRQRALGHDEIKTLWAAWDELGYPWGPLHKLLLLTGQRRGEVAAMRWSELDDPADPREWHIPAERAKSKRPHLVPLSGPATELLRSLPRFRHGDHVFTTTGGDRPVGGFSKAKARIDAEAGRQSAEKGFPAVEPWRAHDLRRTLRTEMARLGISDAVAERVLNHAGDQLVRTYNVHQYEEEKRRALEAWAAELNAFIAGRIPRSNIETFPGSKTVAYSA